MVVLGTGFLVMGGHSTTVTNKVNSQGALIPTRATALEEQILKLYPESENPSLFSQSTPRDVKRVIPANGSEYSLYGLHFSVPWTDLLKKNEKPGVGTQLFFPQQKFVTVYEDGYLSERFVTGSDGVFSAKDRQQVSDYFGTNITSDKYMFYRIVLDNTPDRIGSSTTQTEALARAALTSVKAVITTGTRGKVYSFNLGNVKGFQLGDTSSEKPIVLYVFDQANSLFNLSIAGTQDEVDYILSSLSFL